MKKIAFVVGVFPAISETFLINQVVDLEERGWHVSVFSFREGAENFISERFRRFEWRNEIYYLNSPKNIFKRVFYAIPKIIRLLLLRPSILFKALNVKKYGKNALSLKLIFWIEPWIGHEHEFDLVHCHFGTIANKFLIMKDILGLKQKIITTFYGYDVSHIARVKGERYYDRLKQESSIFLVMSENMKDRVMQLGFPEEKIKVHPISIDVASYPYSKRTYQDNDLVKMVSVGRFVEKKGFDDLLKALAIVKQKTNKKFVCDIVGDGELREDLHHLAKELKIEDVVHFRGYMMLQNIIELYGKSHLYIQASKTAKNGDME